MTRFHRAALTALVMALVAAGSLWAVGEGRILGTVTDAEGKPLEGVKITLTLPEVPSFKQEKTTDKKGKFTLLVIDATKEYQIQLEKEGHAPFQESLKPLIGETLRRGYTLPALEVAPPEPDPEVVKELEGKNNAILAYNEGALRLKNGDLEGAAAKFEEALTHNPDLVEAHAVLADIYVEQKKYPQAIAAAERVLAKDPNDQGALTARYDAAVAVGDTARAQASLDALVQAAPGRDTAVRLLNQGVAHFNEGRMTEAIEIFERALKVDPSVAKTHYMLGLSYTNNDNKEKAREHLSRFLELAPGDPDAGTAREMLEFLKK